MNYKLSAQEARTEWLKDLRSGEYDQGQGHLCDLSEDAPKYCCLGIACETFLRCEGEELLEVEDTPYHRIYGISCAATPQAVKSWLGLKDPLGAVDFWGEFPCGSQTTNSLASANDAGATFLEIADAIEANTEQLFVKSAQ